MRCLYLLSALTSQVKQPIVKDVLFSLTQSHRSFSSKSNMENMKQASFVKEKEIARGKWLSLNQITYKDVQGKERSWESACRTTTGASGCDAVCVFATLKRLLKFDCLILVKQYRPPMKAYTLEIPAGLIDASESAEKAAVREMKEETGYTCTVKHVSSVTALDPGMSGATVQLVTAEVDGDAEENIIPVPSPEESEFIETILIPVEELLSKLNEYSSAGVIVDSRVLSYALALEKSKKPLPPL